MNPESSQFSKGRLDAPGYVVHEDGKAVCLDRKAATYQYNRKGGDRFVPVRLFVTGGRSRINGVSPL